MLNEQSPRGTEPKPERREKSEFNDLAIVVTTLYPSAENKVVSARTKIGLDFFRRANELGIRCVVNDGGSDENFLAELKKLENVEVRVEKAISIGEATREAMSRAASHKENLFFMWTVPEKTGLLNPATLSKLISQLRSGQADIVIANREGLMDKDSAVSKSMTKLHRNFEIRANKRINKIMHDESSQDNPPLDLWFGAKMMNRVGLQYFLDYRSKLDKWDAVVTPVVNAYKGGKRVVGVEVPFVYEDEQTQTEQNNREMDQKRWMQYREILGESNDPFWKKIRR